MLLAFPGGVLADAFDRRWLLFTVQIYFLVIGILLVGLTKTEHLPSVLLLAFTFALGAGTAVQLPTWQAVVPELVPGTQLRAATRLEMVGVNLGRAAGAALAGLAIARSGVPLVFALNAASVVFLAVALIFWRRPPRAAEGSRERFGPALRAGGRYVWHEPVVRRILLRAGLFIAPAMALWALLPLVAHQQLGLGAGGYGALFGALGVGRDCRRPRPGPGEGPRVHGPADGGSRPAVCRSVRTADRGAQLSRSVVDPGARRSSPRPSVW